MTLPKERFVPWPGGIGTLYRDYFVPFGVQRGQLIYRRLVMAHDLELAF